MPGTQAAGGGAGWGVSPGSPSLARATGNPRSSPREEDGGTATLPEAEGQAPRRQVPGESGALGQRSVFPSPSLAGSRGDEAPGPAARNLPFPPRARGRGKRGVRMGVPVARRRLSPRTGGRHSSPGQERELERNRTAQRARRARPLESPRRPPQTSAGPSPTTCPVL